MLSLATNFEVAANKGVLRPVWLAELYVDASTSYKLTTGKSEVAGASASLIGVTPVTRRLDLVSRAPSCSTAVLTFIRDEQWQSLLYDYALVGAFLDLKLGFEALSSGDYAQHASMIVDKVKVTDTTVEMTCKDAERRLVDQSILWQWVQLHPLQCARRIFTMTMPNARQNANSMDPTNYSSTISHFVVSRGNFVSERLFHGPANALMTPKPAADLVADLARICNGSFFSNEDGEIEFHRFSSAASIHDTWTVDDMTDLEFGPLYEHIYNRVNIASHPIQFGLDGEGSHEISFTVDDTTSQGAHQIVVPGGTDEDYVKELQIKTSWPCAIALLFTNMTASVPGVGQTFTIERFLTHGFCGTAWRDIAHDDFFSTSGFPSSTQYAAHQISADRPAYLKIHNEIIKCSALSLSSNANCYCGVKNVDDSDGVQSSDVEYIKKPANLQFTVAERGACGTTPEAHVGFENYDTCSLVYDVTIHQYLARELLERFSEGVITLRCKTGMDKYALERGDLIGLNIGDDRFKCKGRSGISAANAKFEILGKSVDLESNPPGIWWDLAEADYTSWAARAESVSAQGLVLSTARNDMMAAIRGDLESARVISGMEVASTSGLALTVDPGEASVNPFLRVATGQQMEFNLSASVDAYMIADPVSGDLRIEEVANGAAAPTLRPGECFAQKAVTGAAAISSYIEYGDRSAISGVAVHDKTLAAASINRQQEFGRNLNYNASFTLRTRG